MAGDGDMFGNIGFIGAGNMAQAIGISIVKSGLCSGDKMYVSAPTERNFEVWKKLKVHTIHSNSEIIDHCRIIFLAIKPQQIDEALSGIPVNQQDEKKIIISIVGGLSLSILHEKLQWLLSNYHLVKVVPNMQLVVGEGCSVYCSDDSTPRPVVDLVKKIMSTGGKCEEVSEHIINAVSALASSGSAFVYTFIEALSDGAVKQGIPRALSYRLASQMILGSAKMVLETGKHPSVLKDEVCSPGGTTICGIHALEKGGLRSSVIDAIEATTIRAHELAEKSRTVAPPSEFNNWNVNVTPI